MLPVRLATPSPHRAAAVTHPPGAGEDAKNRSHAPALPCVEGYSFYSHLAWLMTQKRQSSPTDTDSMSGLLLRTEVHSQCSAAVAQDITDTA